MSNYLNEFPEFGKLDVAIPAGFVDASWHNDVSPSFACALDDAGDNRVVLWIDHADAEKREVQGYPRFLATLERDGVVIQDFPSDDWAAIAAWALSSVNKSKGGNHA